MTKIQPNVQSLTCTRPESARVSLCLALVGPEPLNTFFKTCHVLLSQISRMGSFHFISFILKYIYSSQLNSFNPNRFGLIVSPLNIPFKALTNLPVNYLQHAHRFPVDRCLTGMQSSKLKYCGICFTDCPDPSRTLSWEEPAESFPLHSDLGVNPKVKLGIQVSLAHHQYKDISEHGWVLAFWSHHHLTEK